MNKIQKVDNISQVNATLKNLSDLGRSVYLWQKSKNNLILNKTVLDRQNHQDEKLEFVPLNPKEKLRYKDGLPIFCYFEENLYIFKSMVLNSASDKVEVTYPKFILFLQRFDKSQSKKTINEIIEELSKNDKNNEVSQMLGQLLSIINIDESEPSRDSDDGIKKIPLFDNKKKSSEPKKYEFSKGQEVKESTTKYVLDNKQPIQEGEFKAQKITYEKGFNSLIDSKATIIKLDNSVVEFQTKDILTDSVILEVPKEDIFKVGEKVQLTKLLGQDLPGKLEGIVEKIEKPSDYTKSFDVTISYTEASSSYRRETGKERIGLQVCLGEEEYTDEYFYDLEKTATDTINIFVIDKVDLHIGIKIKITNMYGIRLKKEIFGEITDMTESTDSEKKGHVVTIRYVNQ